MKKKARIKSASLRGVSPEEQEIADENAEVEETEAPASYTPISPVGLIIVAIIAQLVSIPFIVAGQPYTAQQIVTNVTNGSNVVSTVCDVYSYNSVTNTLAKTGNCYVVAYTVFNNLSIPLVFGVVMALIAILSYHKIVKQKTASFFFIYLFVFALNCAAKSLFGQGGWLGILATYYILESKSLV